MADELKTVDYAGFVASMSPNATFVSATFGLVAEYAELQAAMWPDAAGLVLARSSDAAVGELGDVVFYLHVLARIVGYAEPLNADPQTYPYLADADRAVTRSLGVLAQAARKVLERTATVEIFVQHARVQIPVIAEALAFLRHRALGVSFDAVCSANAEKLSKRWPNGHPSRAASDG